MLSAESRRTAPGWVHAMYLTQRLREIRPIKCTRLIHAATVTGEGMPAVMSERPFTAVGDASMVGYTRRLGSSKLEGRLDRTAQAVEVQSIDRP